MKLLLSAFALCLLVSCTGHGGGAAAGASTSDAAAGASSSGSPTSAQTQKAADDPAKMLIDTDKLKQDIGNVMRSMDSQHPDTTAMKTAASDILTTDANVLSDSGIGELGDKNDPAAKSAQDALKKMRNAMGLTPAKLDSIRKAGASLH